MWRTTCLDELGDGAWSLPVTVKVGDVDHAMCGERTNTGIAHGRRVIWEK